MDVRAVQKGGTNDREGGSWCFSRWRSPGVASNGVRNYTFFLTVLIAKSEPVVLCFRLIMSFWSVYKFSVKETRACALLLWLSEVITHAQTSLTFSWCSWETGWQTIHPAERSLCFYNSSVSVSCQCGWWNSRLNKYNPQNSNSIFFPRHVVGVRILLRLSPCFVRVEKLLLPLPYLLFFLVLSFLPALLFPHSSCPLWLRCE